MKYLALGIIQEKLSKSYLGSVTFEEWHLLYYLPQDSTTSVQKQVQIYFQQIQEVFEKIDILPFRFGNFLENEQQMNSLLENNQKQISEEWSRLKNTAEIRLNFAEGAILQELPEKLLSKKPGIAFWQDKYQQNAQILYFQKVLKLEDTLQLIMEQKTKVQEKKLTFDFLIPKDRVEDFYDLLSLTLQKLNIVQQEVSRPMAPFSFVNLTLKK